MASQISKLRLAFLSSLFTTWPKFSKCKCKITKMSLSLKVNSAKKRQLLKTCHLRHRLRIFLFHRKVMFHSQDTQVYVFVTIPRFTKLVTSWWVLVHEAGCNFEYILWNTTHWVPNPGHLIDICKGNNFQESFVQHGGLGLNPRSLNLAIYSNYWITNHDNIQEFHFFKKVDQGHLKMVNANY